MQHNNLSLQDTKSHFSCNVWTSKLKCSVSMWLGDWCAEVMWQIGQPLSCWRPSYWVHISREKQLKIEWEEVALCSWFLVTNAALMPYCAFESTPLQYFRARMRREQTFRWTWKPLMSQLCVLPINQQTFYRLGFFSFLLKQDNHTT